MIYYAIAITKRLHLHLQFISRELLRELFSPRNHEKWVHSPLLNFSVRAKFYQIASVARMVCALIFVIVIPIYPIENNCNRNSVINRKSE